MNNLHRVQRCALGGRIWNQYLVSSDRTTVQELGKVGLLCIQNDTFPHVDTHQGSLAVNDWRTNVFRNHSDVFRVFPTFTNRLPTNGSQFLVVFKAGVAFTPLIPLLHLGTGAGRHVVNQLGDGELGL